MTKTELRTKIDELVMKYNELKQDGKFWEAESMDEEIKQSVNEYTAEVKKEVFDECKNTENPMIEAVKRLTFTTIATVDTKEDGFPVRIVVNREKPIDLLSLHRYVPGGIGVDKSWSRTAEKANLLFTARQITMLRSKKDKPLDPREFSDSYFISDIGRQIDLGETPLSDTQLLKMLQTVINQMIGKEYKCSSHDVNYIKSVYSRKGRKALTVSCANHNQFRNLMQELCHRIVCDVGYDVEYKHKK